jgi:hypothetical protein
MPSNAPAGINPAARPQSTIGDGAVIARDAHLPAQARIIGSITPLMKRESDRRRQRGTRNKGGLRLRKVPFSQPDLLDPRTRDARHRPGFLAGGNGCKCATGRAIMSCIGTAGVATGLTRSADRCVYSRRRPSGNARQEYAMAKDNLPPDVTKRIRAALTSKSVPGACPMCGSHTFNIVDGCFAPRFAANLWEAARLIGEQYVLPCVGLTCKNCGYLTLFSIDALGLSDVFPEGRSDG